MQTFDVYLKKRLTEIDVIITQLVQRDAFSMYDWLNIFAIIDDELEIRKALKPEAEMFLDVSMPDVLKVVHEKVDSAMYLDVVSEFAKTTMADGEAEMFLSASEISILEKSFAEGEDVLEIFASPLDYYVALSLGNAKFDMSLLVNELDTLKYSLEKFSNDFVLSADVDMASKKVIDIDELKMFLDIAPTDIFYLLTIAGEAEMYLHAHMVDDVLLKNVLHDPEFEMWLDATAEKDFTLIKSIEIDNTLRVFADIVETIIQYVHPFKVDMYLDCEASAGLKRYRKLKELKGHPLRDYNGMSLWDFYYIIIED